MLKEAYWGAHHAAEIGRLLVDHGHKMASVFNLLDALPILRARACSNPQDKDLPEHPMLLRAICTRFEATILDTGLAKKTSICPATVGPGIYRLAETYTDQLLQGQRRP